MSVSVVLLVLASAIMHASWNALLKGGSDRLRSITIMSLAASLASVAWAAFLPAPRMACWPFIGLSAALHVAYNFLLISSYRHADLGVSYPIARGSSPLLVAVGAAMFAGERLDAATVTGIALVCLGIIGLARVGRVVTPLHDLVPALSTGVSIAAYTVVDGLGSRISGNSWAYSAWLFLSYGPAMLVIMLFWGRGGGSGLRLEKESIRSALGGVVSLGAYSIVIWAASISPMGPVSALRETSVVFAMVLGWFFLGERMGWGRLVACLVVAAGAACLGLSRH